VRGAHAEIRHTAEASVVFLLHVLNLKPTMRTVEPATSVAEILSIVLVVVVAAIVLGRIISLDYTWSQNATPLPISHLGYYMDSVLTAVLSDSRLVVVPASTFATMITIVANALVAHLITFIRDINVIMFYQNNPCRRGRTCQRGVCKRI
jgi:hypothetical protein